MMSDTIIVITAVISVFITTRILKILTGSMTREVLLSGAIIGIIESYDIYIQPNFTLISLPALPESASLFVGVFGITRAVVLVLEIFPVTQPWVRTITG